MLQKVNCDNEFIAIVVNLSSCMFILLNCEYFSTVWKIAMSCLDLDVYHYKSEIR